MNCLRFWCKKRPREQLEEKKQKFQLQVEEATGNISKTELEKKALQANGDVKLEDYQKQQNIDELTEKLKSLVQAMVVAELEDQKLSNAYKFAELEQQNALQEKVVKMEAYQKQQQQNIIDLQKTVAVLNDTINGIGLTPQNRWDSAACHDQLALSEPDRLIVQNNGMKWGRRSVFAEESIPKGNSGIFYYELKMLAKESIVRIGFATKQMPLMDGWVGDYKGT